MPDVEKTKPKEEEVNKADLVDVGEKEGAEIDLGKKEGEKKDETSTQDSDKPADTPE